VPQNVTPELRRWIIEQATAGFPPDQVLTAMRNAGWDEDTAVAALETTLADHLKSIAPAQPLVMPASIAEPAAVRLPTIDLVGSPRRIDAGDRWVEIVASVKHPRVVVLGGLLSADECDAIIEQARPHLARSLTVADQDRRRGAQPGPHQRRHVLRPGPDARLLQRIEARIARLMGWPLENGEGMQVLHYRPGAEYKPTTTISTPPNPARPPSSSAAASAWPRW
jgi:prolyl 4-hydroxylase